MATELVTAEAEAEAIRHAEAVSRALARRGMDSIEEYKAEQDRRQAGRAEAEADSAASQARRLTAAPKLAETDNGQIRRGQWIEADASLLQTVRRRAWRLLPWHTAEEMAAEVITAELEAGREAGRAGCVRAERLTAAYLGLTARDWQTGREARRLAEMAETPDSLADVLADERADIAAEAEAEAAEAEAAEVSAEAVYRQAASLARRLWLTADMPVIACLSQAVSGLTGAELASLWHVSASAWKRAAAAGGREVQASYPDGAELMRRLLPADLNYARRQTGADGRQVRYDVGAVQVEADGLNYWRRQCVQASRARRIGADLPAIGRMRSAAQLDREADVLLSRPQLPGRKPTASRASTGASRILAAPDHWQTERPLALADMLAPLRRLLAARQAAAEAPRQDGRKRPGTSAAPGMPAGLADLMAAAPDMPAETGTARLAPRRTGTAAEVLAWLTGAEAEAEGWLRLAAWAEAPIESADRPRLAPWQPGQARRRQAARPSAIRLAAEASLAAVSAAEAAEAGRQGARPYLAAHGASEAARDRAHRRLWLTVWMPADRRRAWLAAPMCSLDVATAAEHTAEQARPFLSAAELGAEAEAADVREVIG